MGGSQIWQFSILGVVAALAVLSVVLLIRAWPRSEKPSAREREELASAPMSALQKRAWSGLLIGVVTLVSITAILSRYGAMAYWENDQLRTVIVAIFIGGLVGYSIVLASLVGPELSGDLDERDREILARAPVAQSAAMLIAMAVWMVSLQRIFHGQEGIPRVYLYLMFGSIILVNVVAHSAGILFGYWVKSRYAQG